MVIDIKVAYEFATKISETKMMLLNILHNVIHMKMLPITLTALMNQGKSITILIPLLFTCKAEVAHRP